jgi:hypothetical protein
MRKQQLAIIILALWLTIVSVFMIFVQQFDLEIFFALFFIGILVIVYLMESDYVQFDYQRNIRYLIVVGLVIFGVIVVQKIIEILGYEIVFQ